MIFPLLVTTYIHDPCLNHERTPLSGQDQSQSSCPLVAEKSQLLDVRANICPTPTSPLSLVSFTLKVPHGIWYTSNSWLCILIFPSFSFLSLGLVLYIYFTPIFLFVLRLGGLFKFILVPKKINRKRRGGRIEERERNRSGGGGRGLGGEEKRRNKSMPIRKDSWTIAIYFCSSYILLVVSGHNKDTPSLENSVFGCSRYKRIGYT